MTEDSAVPLKVGAEEYPLMPDAEIAVDEDGDTWLASPLLGLLLSVSRVLTPGLNGATVVFLK